MTIEKKCWPARKNLNFAWQTLKPNKAMFFLLQEWDTKTHERTGLEIEKKFSYVLKVKECIFWPKEEIGK